MPKRMVESWSTCNYNLKEPTGLDGPPSQPTALPADLHGGVTGAAGRRPCASTGGWWLGNGLALSKNALQQPRKKNALGTF